MTVPFEFAVVADDTTTASAWLASGPRAESLGYHAVFVTDHVTNQLAPLPALTAAALRTERLRVGTYVLNNDLRHPVLVAKDFAALHALSGGRSILGLGAGWLGADYGITGVRRNEGRIRLARLTEAVRIVKALLTGRAVDIDGSHYRVQAEPGLVAVDRDKGPALLIGGAKRGALQLAASEADIVSIVSRLGADGIANPNELTDARVDIQVAYVREVTEGRTVPPRLNHIVWECLVMRRPERVRDTVARAYGLTAKEVLRSPGLLVGTVDEVIEMLLERRERWGFSFITVPMSALDAFAPVVSELAGA